MQLLTDPEVINDNLSDISWISSLVKLNWLDLSGNIISDYSPLDKVINLNTYFYSKIDIMKGENHEKSQRICTTWSIYVNDAIISAR